MIIKKKCSVCDGRVDEIIDLGLCPPANNFVKHADQTVRSYPLIIDFCKQCFCIQLRHCLSKNELYSYYTYSTPKIDSLESHYSNLLEKLNSLGYANLQQSCIEIGSNNGNLLKFLEPYFNEILGVDPAKNIAKLAIDKGINTVIDFFSNKLAKEISEKYQKFDVAIARHMFAHNEDPAELLSAISLILKDDGVFLIENAYALDTFQNGEFDQIYHEHMFYFSALNISALMKKFNFELIDFSHSNVHGGSGVFICAKKGKHVPSPSVEAVFKIERAAFKENKIFDDFRFQIESNKTKALDLINSEITNGKIVGAYGAPAKAFTVFSFYELNNSAIAFCIDTTPTKIGKVFPYFNIPVMSEGDLKHLEYNTIIVNAWNYKEDIIKKASSIFKKGTKLVFLIPNLNIYIVK